jgi:NAD(P)-dependent dehydrogenase (short-subunit alcohol dehydrogenase family)
VPERFADRVVWITGASAGIGRALALHFALTRRSWEKGP